MEALLLAGGRGERLGDAAAGRPKPLVAVAGRPLAAWSVERLAHAGVGRVIVACAAGWEQEFADALAGLGAEVVPVGEPEPLGRGGGLRLASARRAESGPTFALNGDELVDLDFEALLAGHRESGAAATIAVARPRSPFGLVQLADDDRVTGFEEAGRLPVWVSCGVYVLGDEALERLPERGDHETTTFPELAAAGRLRAHRHHGLWLTVNTPKELRLADEHLRSHPAALASYDRGMPDPSASPNLNTAESFAFRAERTDKPWGHELLWALTDRYAGKVLFVRAGEALSLQFHRQKEESWYVLSGRAELEVGAAGEAVLKTEVLTAGEAFHFPPGTVHRVRALEDTRILEASTPDLDDVVRLEDEYGRSDPPG